MNISVYKQAYNNKTFNLFKYKNKLILNKIYNNR